MALCPFCRQGSLQIITPITQAEVIKNILRHMKLLQTHSRSSKAYNVVRGLVGDVCAVER
jgi:hypothetical protein